MRGGKGIVLGGNRCLSAGRLCAGWGMSIFLLLGKLMLAVLAAVLLLVALL
jgi:hypothetical protein